MPQIQDKSYPSPEKELLSTQEELAKRNAELLRANKLQAAFLANMSHELRTPLAAINGFAEVLLNRHFGPLTEKQESYLRDIYDSGRQLLELINTILDYSKIEADKMILQVKRGKLESLVQQALVVVKGQAEAKNISLNIDNQSQHEIIFDPVRIKQVLYNYLSNAVKFTPVEGEIKIEISENEKEVCLEVIDNGIGIDESDIPRLFQPFSQLDNATNRNYQGTGLGLALSKRIIDIHSGRVWVTSHKGEGSRFGFALPIINQKLFEQELAKEESFLQGAGK
ncbi:MAG: HAMP domain-containing sensor histidine kinase [Deinococcales bacterium]